MIETFGIGIVLRLGKFCASHADQTLGYIIEYKYISGRWTMPLRDLDVEAALPDRIKRAKQSSKSDGCKTFKAMWDRQNNDTHKEQSAFITDKGIFWLPDNENDINHAYSGPTTDYGGEPGKQWFVLNGVVYYILANIHTHPTGPQWEDSPSNADLNFAKNWKIPGYVISDGGIYKVNANGQNLGIIDYNYGNIFNCDLDQNIVEELR
ncbi:hypothetical protein IC229_01400 [Spirosoma sp. BT702]|uniref:Uncharacterized protein n=1 Tax=Spirosoma profusum TaxID=2771354 RepID=A0A926XWT5_9BACT|nr:hypothetical protein [Spirosoma profusum]MBD2699272.1 hypothetical protein [Spirosoma profusum]